MGLDMLGLDNLGIASVAIIIALIAYSIYVLYKSIRSYMEYRSLLKEYLSNADETYEKKSDAIVWGMLYFALCVISIVCIVFNKSDDLITKAAFVFVIFYALSFVIEVSMKRTIYFGKTHFIYDKTCCKYKNVRKFNITGKISKTYEIYISTQVNPVKVTKKYGDMLIELLNNEKANRKITLKK